MSTEPASRHSALTRKLAAMSNALAVIANHDCDFAPDVSPDRPCTCAPCVAKAAIATENDWRYIGNRPERLQGNSHTAVRERAMVAAWKHYMTQIGGGTPDYRLTQILGLDEVTPHEWYVCTTLIQWLATNVGQCTLSEANYHYKEPRDPSDPPTANVHVKTTQGVIAVKVSYCIGTFDPGAGKHPDGNMQKCSAQSGCGLTNCPYKPATVDNHGFGHTGDPDK